MCHQHSCPESKTRHYISYKKYIYTRQNQDITVIKGFPTSMVIENKKVITVQLEIIYYLYNSILSPETFTFVRHIWP